MNQEPVSHTSAKYEPAGHEIIRQELQRRRHELLSRLSALKNDIQRSEGPLPADFAEQVIELENLDVLFELDEVSRHELNQINNALARLQSGDYEHCVACGGEIGADRLHALPTAETCIRCAEASSEQ